MVNRVDVIFVGYSVENETGRRSKCTCTLVRTSAQKNIIVDTMTAWDGKRLRQALLDKFGLRPKDIHYVICTSGDFDHIGCNHLFKKAVHIVGSRQTSRDEHDRFTVSAYLDEGEVSIELTAGHTGSSVSVIVRHTRMGVVVICGDLFKCFADIDRPEKWMIDSVNIEEQRRQRVRVAESCHYIIPGHGPGFPMSARIRHKLRKQLRLNPRKMPKV